MSKFMALGLTLDQVVEMTACLREQGCRKETATMDKIAVVTGAARGIGRAIALRLARDGADVAVVSFLASEEADFVSGQNIPVCGTRNLGA